MTIYTKELLAECSDIFKLKMRQYRQKTENKLKRGLDDARIVSDHWALIENNARLALERALLYLEQNPAMAMNEDKRVTFLQESLSAEIVYTMKELLKEKDRSPVPMAEQGYASAQKMAYQVFLNYKDERFAPKV